MFSEAFFVFSNCIYAHTFWNPIGMGIWIAEIEFKQGGWSKARRIVIIKQEEEIREKITGKKVI